MKNKRMRKILYLVAGVTLLIGVVGFSDNDFKLTKNLDIYFSLFREVNMFYVDEVDPEKLVKESIDGMLKTLDPYTVYIPEEDIDDFKFMTTGEYGGIGALIRAGGEGYAIVSDPYEGFPAQKAGIQAGDVILKIDGKSTKDKKLDEVSSMLKGSPKSTINVEIQRLGESSNLKFTFQREEIKIDNVQYADMVTPDIAFIRATGFTVGAGEEVKQAVKKLVTEKGAKKIILDLRGNPGGLLDEAVKMASVFVERGQEIVSTKGKIKQWNAVYKSEDAPFDTEIPLVVMVNRGSASASEIVAGAIQDLDRGIILGQRTFGKGLVQSTRSLSYNTKLKVTTAKYYIPSGRCIQALDYTHRNEDGSVGRIPDSLISEYKTKGGRKVFDGGGIVPDVTVTPETIGEITISLYSKNLIFDFATLYKSKNPVLPPIEKFNIDDELFNQFMKFLEGKDFDYKTQTEKKLDELITSAKKEKYFTIAESEIDKLKNKLSHDKLKDIELFREEIKQLIKEEIVGRYYYQKGSTKATLEYDNALHKAIEVLNDSGVYQDILKGKYKSAEDQKKQITSDEQALKPNQNNKVEPIEIGFV